MAACACRAGYEATVLDCFADADTRQLTNGRVHRIAGGAGTAFDEAALTAAADAFRDGDLIYGAGFEERPELLDRLAARARLRGNRPEVVAAVADPVRFFARLDAHGIPHPETRFAPPGDPAGWLVKRGGGSGGLHVRPAQRAERSVPGAYFQRFKPGHRLSVLFLADGRRAAPVGWNVQRIQPLPGLPFAFGGVISGARLPDEISRRIERALGALTADYGLVGLNGLDFIQRGNDWYALELNPRPTAAVELYDPDWPGGLIRAHLDACAGTLSARAGESSRCRGMALAYSATTGWADPHPLPEWCADVPLPGTHIRQGDPLCSVHAEGSHPGEVERILRNRLNAVRSRVLKESA